MSRKDFGVLLLIAALFGASFLFIRIAAPVTGALPVSTGRVALGALVPLALLALRRQFRELFGIGRRTALDLLVVGVLLAALPFTLFAVAELRVTASLAAVLNATAPMWGILVAAVWLGQPVTVRRLGGAAIGIAGVAVAVGLGPLPADVPTLASAGACLLAALSYAVGSTWTARRLPGTARSRGSEHQPRMSSHGYRPVATPQGISPTVLAAGQQLGATALLAGPVLVALVAAPPTGATGPETAGALAAIAALGLVCTGVAFVLWFGLLRRIGPVAAVTVTLLAPVFGVSWGAIFLGEPLTLGLVFGAAAVLAGVALINGAPRRTTTGAAPAVQTYRRCPAPLTGGSRP